MDPAYPDVDDGALDGWSPADESRETLFSMRGVTVTGATRVYEDDGLRARVRDATGLDRTWRFFFATRLAFDPSPPESDALRRLVTDRAKKGFTGRLESRGFAGVRAAEDRRLAVDDAEATLQRYEATVASGDGDRGPTLDVDGWLAVWPDGRQFLLAGGAYPRAVADGGDDPAVAAALRAELDPARFRTDLIGLVRATR